MELNCNQCGRILPEKMFRKFSSTGYKSRNGRNPKCKECEYGFIPKEFRVEKECLECKEIKPIDNFAFTNKERDDRQSYCRPCQNKRRQNKRNMKNENSSRCRRKDLARKYKISLSEYALMLANQEYKCKICGITLEDYKEFQRINSKNSKKAVREFSVDHCHITGKVRGLLCTKCNLGLGSFQDSPELLTKASEYLLEHQPSFF